MLNFHLPKKRLTISHPSLPSLPQLPTEDAATTSCGFQATRCPIETAPRKIHMLIYTFWYHLKMMEAPGSLEKFRRSIGWWDSLKKYPPPRLKMAGKPRPTAVNRSRGALNLKTRCVFLDSSATEVSDNSSAAEDTSLRILPSKMMVGRLFLDTPFSGDMFTFGGGGVHPFLF